MSFRVCLSVRWLVQFPVLIGSLFDFNWFSLFVFQVSIEKVGRLHFDSEMFGSARFRSVCDTRSHLIICQWQPQGPQPLISVTYYL